MKAFVEQIEQAIARLNASVKHPVRVAWGFHDPEEMARVEQVPAERRPLMGLIAWDIFQLDLTVAYSLDKDRLDYCRLAAMFGEWNADPNRTETPDCEDAIALPTDDVAMLYNVLVDVQSLYNCHLDVVPLDGAIIVAGVSTELPLVAVTWQTLLDAMLRVTGAADAALRRLLLNVGRNRWEDSETA